MPSTSRHQPSPCRRRRGLPAVLGLLALQLLAAGPLAADDVLEIVRRTSTRLPDGREVAVAEERGMLYLGRDEARFDQGAGTSWILRRREGELLLVRHDA